MFTVTLIDLLTGVSPGNESSSSSSFKGAFSGNTDFGFKNELDFVV